MIILADIQFHDGSVHRCTGTIQGGEPNVRPGFGVPWKSTQEVREHVVKNELKLVRIVTRAA